MPNTYSKRQKNGRSSNIYNKISVLTIVVLVSLVVINKINFLTKSEVIATIPVNFKEYTGNDDVNFKSDEILNIEINQDEEGKKYIIFPTMVNGYYAERYRVTRKIKSTVEVPVNEIQNSINTNTSTNINNTSSKVDNIQSITNVVNTMQSEELSFRGRKRTLLTNDNIVLNEINENIINNDGIDNVENVIEGDSESEELDSINENVVNENTDVENVIDVDKKPEDTAETNTLSEDEEDDSLENTTTDSTVENTTVNQNSIVQNNTFSHSVETIIDDYTEYKPGDKFYLNDDEEISIGVVYDTMLLEKIKLYKQELTSIVEDVNIKITGYMPAGYHINSKIESIDDMNKLKEGVVVEGDDAVDLSQTEVLLGLDLSLVDDNSNEYQPIDYGQNVNVEISSDTYLENKLSGSDVIPVHISESYEVIKDESTGKDVVQTNIVFEQIELAYQGGDTAEFYANSFSKYAILKKSTHTATSFTIEDYDDDYNYYIGKNFTDNDGVDSGTYTDSTLQKVNVIYYSYNPNKTTGDNIGITCPLTFNNNMQRNGNRYTFSTPLNVSSTKYIDKNAGWEIKIAIPSGFNTATLNVEETRNANSSFNLSNVDYTNNIITFTGTNWLSGWTHNSDNSVRSYREDTSTSNLRIVFDANTYTTYDYWGNPQQTYYVLNGNEMNNVRNVNSFTTLEKFQRGYISSTERQTQITYTKAVYKSGSNISVELIDNPFMDRPIGYGFNGWLSTNSSANISINADTKVQTLSINVPANINTSDTFEIKLYPDWKEATYVFVSAGSSNTNNGLSALYPVGNFATAYNVINSNYKTATNASDRELNIIVLMNGSQNIQTFGRALTLTSLADNTDYRSEATLNVNANISLTNDFQIDFVNTTGSVNYRSANYTDYFNYRGCFINRYIVGDRRNLRIGRGMYPLDDDTYKTTFAQVIGGPTGSSNTSRSYRTVVESGKYFNIQSGATNASYNYYGITTATYTSDATLVIGNDIDRALEDDDSLKISAQLSSRTAAGNVTSKTTNGYAFDMIIKSGTIGREIFDQRVYEPYIYAGIYCGGSFSANDDKGHRRVIIEGGNVANIIGGLAINANDKNRYRTEIYVKDGYVQNIVGGAGVSTTNGNRTIQVTGGTIKYSISGASNGYAASDTDPGNLNGKTMVYVGGNAVVGADDNGNVTNDALYEVESGSVLGAGNGNANYKDTAGSAEKTHVIIDGNATIHGNVYAGGNYGQVNLSNSYVYSYSYGYENKSANIVSGETYVMSTSQTIGAYLYTTRRNRRYSFNTRNFNANSTNVGDDGLWIFERQQDGTYIIQNSYYDYYGAYIYYTNNSFNLTDNENNAVRFYSELNGDKVGFYYLYNNTKRYFSIENYGNYSTTPVYFYLLKRVSIANLVSAPTQEELVAQVDIVDGTVKGNVYGGSNQNNINGCSKTTMKSGKVEGCMYGGSNTSGTIAQNATIEITGGIIGDGTHDDAVFAGGLGTATSVARNATLTIRDDNENVNITGNIYGGSSQGRVKGTSTTTIYNDTSNDSGENSKKITLSSEIFGGGKGTDTIIAYNDNDTTVSVDGLDNSSSVTVYGGANVNGQTTGDILVNIGNNETTFVDKVFGGGKSADVQNTTTSCNVYVYSNGTVNKAYGGGNEASIIGNKNSLQRAVTIDGGKVLDSVYGGSNESGTLDYSHVILLNGAKAKTVYGAGFGGNTSVGDTEVSISGSTANTVYGGGFGGKVTRNTLVTIDSSSVPVVTENDSTYGGNVYGGGQGVDATVSGNTSVDITSSTIGASVYGGGDMGKVEGNTNISTTGTTITSNIYGGGNNGDVSGKGTLNINSSNSDTVYGGGKSAKIGSTDVTVTNGSTVHDVFGGGQGSTAVTETNTKVVIDRSNVTTKTVTVEDEEGNPTTEIVGGNVFGGGDSGNVTGNTSVEIRESSTIASNVYGGGNEATVGGNTVTSIKSSTVTKDVFGGGNKADVSGTTSVTMESTSSANNVYGGGNDANVLGSTSVTMKTNASANNVYGGGNNGTVGSSESNNATTTVNLNYANITQNIYGGGNKGNVYGTANVTSSGSIGNTVYGGGCAATVYATDVNINNSSIYSYVFGGGQGVTALTTTDTKVKVNSSTINVDVYGGGDSGAVGGSTMVGLTGATILGSAYGAGNGADATVANNSYIYAEGTTSITKNLFGGGNASTTGGYTEAMLSDTRTNQALQAEILGQYKNTLTNSWSIVDISGATIGGNVYGGANSSVIQGNAIVNIGNSAISEFYGNPVVDYICADIDNNTKTITITNPNKKTTYTKGNINIGGTVFGGGEQMVEGKDYDFDSISVVGVIDINIDGNNYSGNENLTIGGSIFGSGNASSASKNGKITIKNFGTESEIKRIISIQRATEVVIDNSQINMHGIVDSTNKYGNEKYTFNIVDLLKLKNDSVLYLERGANRLSGYESAYDDNGVEKYNTVTIKNDIYDEHNDKIYTIDGNKFLDADGHILAYLGENNKYFSNEALTNEIDRNTKETIDELTSQAKEKVTVSMSSDTDNRIYMYSGVNLHLATTEDELTTHPGTVKGMTFFGIYMQDGSDLFTGMYSKDHVLGSDTSYNDRDFLSSYVQGIHYHENQELGIAEHDIMKDGFYTNYENINPDYETYKDMSEDTNSVTTTYASVITPTPPNAAHYKWYAKPGSNVHNFEFTLSASKFSTFGTKNVELDFGDTTCPNAKITITKQMGSYLNKYYLIDKSQIPNVAATDEDALKYFALEMKTGNNGWKLNGSTDFSYNPDAVLEEEKATRDGTEVYEIENSNVVPKFAFYLYHSNNIDEEIDLGTYTITMDMEYPLDAVGNIGEATLIFKINLDTRNFSDDTGYDAAITPGEQFDIFANTDTKITHKSSFSTYFSLAQSDFMDTVVTKEKNNNPTGEDDEYVYTYVRDYFIDNDDLHRVIATRDYPFPEDTGITLIDRSIADEPKYYYYNVTAQDALMKTEYRFSDFYAMGSTDVNNKYDEPAMQDIYYDEVNDYEYEKFILIFNFQNSKFRNLDDARAFETIIERQPITIELRGTLNGVEVPVVKVLDKKREDDMYFSIYKTKTNIDIEGELDKEKIYLGNRAILSATTEYQLATTPQGDVIFDTQYFDKKLGTVIKLYKKGVNNGPDELMQGSDILGLYYSLGTKDYYPRTDGTTRIKMAEKVSNVTSQISVHTENASLQSGEYYFVLQSFGSPDGIYFGTDISATSRNIEFELINDIYGLDVTIPDNEAIVDYNTGFVLTDEGRTSTDDRSLDVDITYASGLEAPFLGVSLYRRTYNNIFDTDYVKVDLADYVELCTVDDVTGEETTESLEPVIISNFEETEYLNTYEYKALDVDEILDLVDVVTDNIDILQKFKFKNPGNGSLVTGTYKLVYTLYDRNTVQKPVLQTDGTYVSVSVLEYEPIGSHFTYIIIK